MARGRAKKSAQKGKGKNKGPSSSPGKKMKSVDEVIGVQPIVVPEEECKEQDDRKDSSETEKRTPKAPEEQMQRSSEKAVLSEWVNVVNTNLAKPATARRMSWADECTQVSSSKHVVTIVNEDIQDEIEYWSSAVVCYVLGANPPLNVMDGYFRRIWGKQGIDKIAMMGRGIFLVRFNSVEASLKVTTEGMQFFDQKPLITRMWDPDVPVDKTNVESVPIWIKMPGLALKYWGEKSLFKIAGLVGKAIKMDNTTKSKDRLNFARVMVEVQMKQELPDTIIFCNEYGMEICQNIEYEWRPSICKKCSGIGHSEEDCRKNEGKKVWVKKNQVAVDKEGFQRVGTRTPKPQEEVHKIQVSNTFEALLEDAEETGKDEEISADTEEENNRAEGQMDTDLGEQGDGLGLTTPLPNG